MIFRFGLLYSGFAPKYWWYELILYGRKLSIILIVTFAGSNDQQLHLALGTLVALLYFQEHIMPFDNPEGTPAEKTINKKLHRIESCSLLVLISMVWSAVYFVIGCDDNDGVCSLLGVVVLGGNVVFLILCSGIFLEALGKKHRIVAKLSNLTHSFRMRSRSGGRESSSSVIDVNDGGAGGDDGGAGASSKTKRRLSSRELMMVEMTNQNREFSGTNPMPLNGMGANVSTPSPTATSSTNHWNRMKRLTNGTGAFKHSGKQRAARLAKGAVTETNATPRVNNAPPLGQRQTTYPAAATDALPVPRSSLAAYARSWSFSRFKFRIVSSCGRVMTA